ncbi:MAG TPA: EamA family transporter [Burkholderiaceae bacterium]|nr:EamA family transporter [Burkholderiaceae bacterium]HMX11741.1 EamA family transporter [Burkholderiaceae bacterium]HMY98975.1 EamA family transporter [Burkholderiaceae bacterium]HNB43631.1 EamA family transporter [Burkholderiaceae bacterium]HNG81684.1 EamA family transporter [Burkholderiaceae bacterium]
MSRPHPHHPPLPLTHLLLALAVVTIWGSNFVVIKLALAKLPPLLFAALRFTFALLPAMLVLPRPKVPWTQLAAYGLLIGAGQFGLLYIALTGHITPGLASLVIQTQVFFTIALAMGVAGERPRAAQGLALLLAGSGVGLIALNTGGETRVSGLVLVLGAALSWAAGNIVATRAKGVNALSYVVWASAWAIAPLLALSLLLEGWPAIRASLLAAGPEVWAAVLWQSWGNTLIGYTAWAWLLARHPAATISPLALLVPVVGMSSSAWWLGEPLPAWKLAAGALVIAGLGLNLLAARRRR